MKKLPEILLFLSFLILIIGPFFLEHLVWKRNYQKINDINERITLLEENFQQNPQKIDSLAMQKLALEIKKLEQKIKEYDWSLRNDFYWLIRFGIPGTLITLIVTYWSVYQSSFKLAMTEAKKEIEKRFKSEEQLLREEKKILVINHEKANRNEMSKHFNAGQFENVHYCNVDKLSDYSLKAYDLVMFNNASKEIGEHFTENELEGIIRTNMIRSDTVVFYYNGGFLNKYRTDERFNSANFKSQIIPNILNLLKFQELSKRM